MPVIRTFLFQGHFIYLTLSKPATDTNFDIYTENACRHSFFLYPNMFFFSNYCQYHKIIVHVIETEEYVEHEHELCLFIHLLFLKINLMNLVREMILNLNHSRIGLSPDLTLLSVKLGCS